MDGLFDLVKLVKVQYLLLLGDRQIWHLCRLMGRGKGGLRASLRMAVDAALLCHERVRQFVGRAGAAGAHVECLVLCSVRTGCVMGCGALRVRGLRVGDAQVGSASGHA